MPASPACFHHLEWPAPGARVRGPVLWLRGWVVGTPGNDFHDVRAVHRGQIHLGLLGLPRSDVATHFQSPRPWLPAEFVLGVPVIDGAAEIYVEAQDAFGAWHGLQTLPVTVAPDGEASAREAGLLESQSGGSWTTRGTHLPFHGHLDDPRVDVTLEHGRAKIFGWLLHDTQAIKTVWATTDLRVFQQLEPSVTDDALAAKVPSLPQARHARLRGAVDVPPTLSQPACVRIYAELADRSVHLCLARRFTVTPTPTIPSPTPVRARPAMANATLSAQPSGRPRRLLLCTLNLQGDDSTRRALDVARHLTAGAQWSVRLLTTADGPLRAAFESAGVAVQIVNPQPVFSADSATAAAAALAALGRQIWFKHLDAMAVFDAECLWAAQLGRQHQLPVLVDCSRETPLPASTALFSAGSVASALVFASDTADRNCATLFNGVPAAFVPPWHSVELPVRPSGELGRPHLMVAPIRGTAAQGAPLLLLAADWLARHHPDFAAQHRLVLTGLRDTREEQLFLRDVMLNQPALMAIEAVGLDRAAACISPAFSDPQVRSLLNAAAIGVPIVTSASPALQEIFSPPEMAFVDAGNPLALAHALVDLAANPAATQRRALAAQRHVLAHHAPQPLLLRWQEALESMVAAAR